MQKIIVCQPDINASILKEFNAQNLDFKLIEVCKKSLHKDDYYLFVVLAKNNNRKEDESYIVYTYNHSTGALNHGCYDLSREKAEKAICDKVNYL